MGDGVVSMKLDDWVLIVAHEGLELHCRQAPHSIDYVITLDSSGRTNRWSVESANDIGATVCALCLWRVLPPRTLAFVYGGKLPGWESIPWP